MVSGIRALCHTWLHMIDVAISCINRTRTETEMWNELKVGKGCQIGIYMYIYTTETEYMYKQLKGILFGLNLGTPIPFHLPQRSNNGCIHESLVSKVCPLHIFKNYLDSVRTKWKMS